MVTNEVTHWGWVMHKCIRKPTIIDSDNGLSPGWCQAIMWSNVKILFIGPLGINLSEILIKMYIFKFKKMHLKMSSGKWEPFCLSLNELNASYNPIIFIMLERTSWKSIHIFCLIIRFSLVEGMVWHSFTAMFLRIWKWKEPWHFQKKL